MNTVINIIMLKWRYFTNTAGNRCVCVIFGKSPSLAVKVLNIANYLHIYIGWHFCKLAGKTYKWQVLVGLDDVIVSFRGNEMI